MKNYEMFRPNGEKVSVGTMLMARRISAQFRVDTESKAEKLAASEPISDEFYASCDAVVSRWNHNYEVVEQMKADPEFQDQDRRSAYALNLLQIADMASKCEDDTPSSTDQ